MDIKIVGKIELCLTDEVMYNVMDETSAQIRLSNFNHIRAEVSSMRKPLYDKELVSQEVTIQPSYEGKYTHH